MLFLEDIKIELKSQGFEAKQISFSPKNDSAVVCFKSTKINTSSKVTYCYRLRDKVSNMPHIMYI